MTTCNLLVVDCSSVFRTMWEASDGREDGTARDRSLSIIRKGADGMDRVAVVADRGLSFRRAIDRDYKAKRKAPPQSYNHQLDYLLEILACDGYTCWKPPRHDLRADVGDPSGQPVTTYYEADDVIAGIVAWWRDVADEGELFILGNDSDLWQLVDSTRGVVAMTLRGDMIGDAEVRAKFKVNPPDVRWIKAIAGDGDGYKPYPGIGEETAAALVTAAPALGFETPGDLLLSIARGGAAPDGVKLTTPRLASIVAGGEAALRRGVDCATLQPVADGSAVRIPPPDLTRKTPGTPALASYAVILDEPITTRATDAEVPPQESAAANAAQTTIPESRALAAPSPRMLTNGIDPYGLEPASLDDAIKFARITADGRLFPHIGSWQAACAIIEWGRTLGFPAAVALNSCQVIKGRPGWSADAMVAAVRAHPSCELLQVAIPQCTAERAIVRYKKRGEPTVSGGAFDEFTVTITEARDAGFLDGKHSDQWRLRPKNMLIKWCTRELCRNVWQEVLLGCYTPEEIRTGGVDVDIETEEE